MPLPLDQSFGAPRRAYEPGGGGINVSRAIDLLGGKSRAFVALGGSTGHQLQDLMTDLSFDLQIFEAPGTTRQNLAVMDQSTGQQFRFVMPGPVWTLSDEMDLLDVLAKAAIGFEWIVLSGSLPQGLSTEYPSKVCQLLKPPAKLIIDISGDALLNLSHPGTGVAHILRMNKSEAEMMLGRPLNSIEEAAAGAGELIERDVAETVIVSAGALGSVLANSSNIWHAVAAEVPVVSKVGAGDCFVAGLTLALSLGKPVEVALQYGVASAASAVTTPDTQLCTPEKARDLLPTCRLREFRHLIHRSI